MKQLADIVENLLLSGITLITEFLVNMLIGVMSYSGSSKAISHLQQNFLPKAYLSKAGFPTQEVVGNFMEEQDFTHP